MYRFLEARVADYMRSPVVTAAADTPLHELEARFAEHDFNGFPVLDETGALAGIVTKFDVLKVFVFTTRSVLPAYNELAQRTAREIMTRDVITFRPDTPVSRVLQTLVDFRVKSFPVVEHQRVVGMIAREDILRALHDAAAK